MIGARSGREAHTIMLDLADATSVEAALSSLRKTHSTIDLLVNNGAMWLEASMREYTAEEVLGVVNAAVSGTFLLTQGLLPMLRRSRRPDIVTIGSISGLANAALQSVSVPFYAAKHGQRALADGFRQMLVGTPVRSIRIDPPYLEDISPVEDGWETGPTREKGTRGTNRDIVEALIFAVTRPRHVTLSIVVDADDGGLFPPGKHHTQSE